MPDTVSTQMLQARRWITIAAATICLLLALPAQSGAAQFTASTAPIDVVGTQVSGSHVMTLAGGTVTCKTVDYETGMVYTSQEGLGLTPIYENCTAFGFVGSNVKLTGLEGGAGSCGFLLWASGTIDLTCPVNGQEVVIDAGPCTVTIPPQSGLGSVSFASAGSDVAVGFAITGIEYTVHKGFLCPADGTSTAVRSDGKYEGTTTFSGIDGTISYDI